MLNACRGSGQDIPANHHCVVFMVQVMTVHHVLSRVIPESDIESQLLSRTNRKYVLATALMGWRRDAVARQNAAFLEVNMDRMRPIAFAAQHPHFFRSAL